MVLQETQAILAPLELQAPKVNRDYGEYKEIRELLGLLDPLELRDLPGPRELPA